MCRFDPAAHALAFSRRCSSRFSALVGPLAAALALVVCLAGCGASAPSPVDTAVQHYLNALAEGNYSNACALLDRRTRDSLLKSKGSRTTCSAVYTRCLPDDAQVLNRDQSQLLFANVQVSVEGSKAAAAVSGTAVARAIKKVTLAKEHGHWKLTSYGKGLNGCRRLHRAAHSHHNRKV
jgi:hypothetical protein